MDDLSYARHIIPQNSYCLQCDYGNSDFDIRNSFSMFLTYSLPQPSKYQSSSGRLAVEYLVLFLHRHAVYRLFRQRFQRHGRVQ